jgi:feruloyl esterase
MDRKCGISLASTVLLLSAPIAAFSTDFSSKCTSAVFSGLAPSGTTITAVTLYAAGSQLSTGQGPGGQGTPGGPGGTPPAGADPARGSSAGATSTFPYAVCEVKARIPSAINFALSFPADSANWNGRYVGLGGAGTAGSVSEGGTLSQAIGGYAASSSDQGHSGDGSTWEEDTQLLIDFAYRGNHLTAEASKAILKAFYGTAPTYSYFNGCSGGGGAAMAEATRYPGDYNGVLAGAPASNPTRMWPYEVSLSAWTYNDKTSKWPDDYVNKMSLITKAAISACDALDGITDGLIDDPRRCNFDPAALLCKPVTSTSHSDTSCLTPEQVEVVRKIYGGLKDPYSGGRLFPGFVRGSESTWSGHITEQTMADAQYMAYAVLKDPSKFDWREFLLTNPFYYWAFYSGDGALGPILDSMNPDLSGLRAAGTKVVMYHGWNDTNISPGNSIDYYESVIANMHRHGDAKETMRLFLVPGMGHCGGNSGYNSFDMFAPLVSWVEKGVTPDQVVGANSAGNTRPLCPYPEVARPVSTLANSTFVPAKSTDYACVPPAEVRFGLEAITLKSKGVFTAYVTLPRGYNIDDWGIQNVSCNGAIAANTLTIDDLLIANFRVEDLLGVATGDAVPLTLKFTMTHDGKSVSSQATGTVAAK